MSLESRIETRCQSFVVELADERFQNFARRQISGLAREKGPVAPILSGAEEEDLHASFSALAEGGEQIGLDEAGGIDTLRRLHLVHGAQAIAQPRGGFEIERLGGCFHVFHQPGLKGAALAGEKAFRFVHQFLISRLIDPSDAGRAAALDLEQQARPGACLEDGIRTRAQQKRALQCV